MKTGGAVLTPILHSYILGFGSNLGDREHHFKKGLDRLLTFDLKLEAVSQLYETKPVLAATALFLNSAVKISCRHDPAALLDIIHKVEEDGGRLRSIAKGNRTIDIDILLWRTIPPHLTIEDISEDWSNNDDVVKDQTVADTVGKDQALQIKNLSIPHSELLNRSFQLVPAASIAPGWVHPISGRTLMMELTFRNYVLEPYGPWEIRTHSESLSSRCL